MAEVENRKLGEECARGVRDRALEELDCVYGEALAYAEAAYRLLGVTEGEVRGLRPAAERRRLMREARQERKARAAGRRAARRRTVVAAATRWLKRWRSRVIA